MMTLAALRQIADRALGAYAEYDFLCRVTPNVADECVGSECAGKLTAARQEWIKAREELRQALGG